MKFILIVLLAYFNAFSQNSYKITYNYKILSTKYNYTTTLKSYLSGNGMSSLYEEDFMGENQNESENSLTIKSMENNVFYKDILTRVIYFNTDIRMKPFYIKDTMPRFDWEIKEDSKIILGYKCQKATLFFRGLNYVAYFTTEIPYSDGPWKLSGLPGMILESKSFSLDSPYEVLAENVELTKLPIEIKNPHLDKNIISYQEFIKIYKKKYYESVANGAQNSGNFIIPKGTQEVYIED